MKKLLILGGTNFIGRNLVERLLESGAYDITLFNRQRTHSNLFPAVNRIKGDRETNDIKQIAGKNWDCIIDLSCYYPDALERVLDSVHGVSKYLFVSTCSVYDNADKRARLRDEQATILSCSPEQRVDRSPTSYGNRKAECERILQGSGISHVILRPALVFGKYDPTDRLYYWLYQVKKKNELLLPEAGERLFSTTYVFDLVEAIVHSIKHDVDSEVYNVISRPETSIGQLVALAKEFLKTECLVVNGTADFLLKNDVTQWTDMPLWINGDHFTYSNQKLERDLGLKMIPFETALKETIAYYETLSWPEPQYGMSEERKNGLIGVLEGGC
ncbi:MAG: NAD-dependent epimerase/dehydratase family protein [Saprospiraceae bacterium]